MSDEERDTFFRQNPAHPANRALAAFDEQGGKRSHVIEGRTPPEGKNRFGGLKTRLRNPLNENE
ncbi:hypothetical protein [Faunimonas pinastri]|nr:hypothetical protein [Faunimonas pinastri]